VFIHFIIKRKDINKLFGALLPIGWERKVILIRHNVGLNEFDVIDYDVQTGKVIRDAEATDRVADALFDYHSPF